MISDRTTRTMLVLCTVIATLAALHLARALFIPVAFSIFIIALVWPLQSMLQARLPTLLALAVTIATTATLIAVFTFLVAWGLGVVGQWTFASSARFQQLYADIVTWLDGHGIHAAGMITEYFDVNWMLRTFRHATGRAHGIATFLVTTLVFLLLGLLEVPAMRRKLEALDNKELGQTLLRTCESIAAKFRRYMLVRTGMSIATGFAIWAFSLLAGLELATAWGVIAFVLNYIPFIGPFVATVLPSLFAIAQSESWQMAVVVFVCLNLIQFLIGSYLEPRVAGAALAMSPFVVLFSVFLWLFLWGLPGAFIGVPITIAILVMCNHFDETRWISNLMAGDVKSR